jgi:hypothetical protein
MCNKPIQLFLTSANESARRKAKTPIADGTHLPECSVTAKIAGHTPIFRQTGAIGDLPAQVGPNDNLAISTM